MRRDDAQIISKILSGDPSGYRALFERYVLAVEEVVARAWELELAEQAELVEEAFVHAFFNLSKLREPSRFDAYLLGLAHGLALQRRAVLRGSEVHFSEKPSFDVSSLQSPGARDDVASSLRAALAALDPAAREMAEACFFGEQIRPQLLAAERALEVAQVGALLDRAWARFKAFLIARLLDGQQAVLPATAAEPRHLAGEVYEAILRGEPVAEALRLAQHLRGGCDACEAFLSRRASADALDGLLDAALFAQKGPCRRNPALFARILRRLKIDARLSGGRRAIASTLANPQQRCAPLLLAALLGVAGIVVFALRMTPSFQASLDHASLRKVQLAFYLAGEAPFRAEGGAPTDGEERLVEGVPGQSCRASEQLILSYQLPRSSFVAIARLRPDRALELLELPGRRPSGRHVLSIDGVPARLLLKDAVGHNRFIVLASERPFDAERLASLLNPLQADVPDIGGAALPRDVALAWFDLAVMDDKP